MRLTSFKIDHHETYGIVTDDGVIDLAQRLGARYPDLRSVIADDAIAGAAAYADARPTTNVGSHVAAGDPESGARSSASASTTRITAKRRPTMNRCTPRCFCAQRNHRPRIGARSYDRTNRTPSTSRARSPSSSAKRDDESHAIDAWDHIAGYSCYNDGSVREWQRHTAQYTAGKNFPSTGGVRPVDGHRGRDPPETTLTLSCRLNGELMQQATTDQMIFSIPAIIEYISTVTATQPGDVIVTGTPGGVVPPNTTGLDEAGRRGRGQRRQDRRPPEHRRRRLTKEKSDEETALRTGIEHSQWAFLPGHHRRGPHGVHLRNDRTRCRRPRRRTRRHRRADTPSVAGPLRPDRAPSPWRPESIDVRYEDMATVLVTGSNRGIGLALCRAFKERGDEVIATCRRSSPELEALGAEVITGVDVTSDRGGADPGRPPGRATPRRPGAERGHPA